MLHILSNIVLPLMKLLPNRKIQKISDFLCLCFDPNPYQLSVLYLLSALFFYSSSNKALIIWFPLSTYFQTISRKRVVQLSLIPLLYPILNLFCANKPTADCPMAIHRRLELSFNLYLLLLFVGQNRASKSHLHITLRISRFLQLFNK